jgi:hypothetical protein
MEDALVEVLSGNPATVSMFKLLLRPEVRYATIFAHSQGNLITSNALAAVQFLHNHDPKSIAGREVRSYGSPCFSWPEGIRPTQRDYRHTGDSVTWIPFGLNSLGDSSDFKFGIPFTFKYHDFLRYIHSEALLINAYAVVIGGIVVRRDEEHLADELIRLKENDILLAKVLQKLYKMDRVDAVQVACYYVAGQSQTVLRNLKADAPSVIDLLKRMLGERVVQHDAKIPLWQRGRPDRSKPIRYMPADQRAPHCLSLLNAL